MKKNLKYFYKKYSTKSIKNMDFTDQNYRKNNVHVFTEL